MIRPAAPLLAAAASLALASEAAAGVTCSFNPGAKTLLVAMTIPDDLATISTDAGEVVVASGSSSTGLDCSAGADPDPQLTTTDQINVIDSSVGRTRAIIADPAAFKPGVEDEQGPLGQDFDSEIEFNINLGVGEGDNVTLINPSDGPPSYTVYGADGINPNAEPAQLPLDPGERGPDADIFLTGVESNSAGAASSEAGTSPQVLSGNGGSGTGAPFAGYLSLRGTATNDVLTGSSSGNVIEGGPGNDQIRAGDGSDSIYPGTGDDLIQGQDGYDALDYVNAPSGVTVDLGVTGPQNSVGSGVETISGIERVDGSLHADTLTGGAVGQDGLSGRAGDDLFVYSPGIHSFAGGDGVDTATWANSPGPVGANLALATASTSDGQIAVSEIENVIGSPFDDILIGDAKANTLTGLAGVDEVDGAADADQLRVRDGGPDKVVCGTELDLVVADPAGVDTIAADCETVEHPAVPDPDPEPGAGNGDPTTSDPTAAVLDTQIVKRPRRRSADRTPSFSFEAVGAPASGFECRFDKRRFRPCSSPLTPKRLAPGRHRFEVRALDSTSTPDPTPASARFRILG